MNKKIDIRLETSTPTQSTADREQMFATVWEKTTAGQKKSVSTILSPYSSVVRVQSYIALSMLALFLVLVGVGGTITVAEASRPGDVLYPIDRATEQLRLLVANKDKKSTLQAQFLDERVIEFESLLTEGTSVEVGQVNEQKSSVVLIAETNEDKIINALIELIDQANTVSDVNSNERLLKVLRELKNLEFIRLDNSVSKSPKISVAEDRIEVRTDTKQVRLEIKDSVVEVHGKGNKDDYDDTEKTEVSESNDDRKVSGDSHRREEAEFESESRQDLTEEHEDSYEEDSHSNDDNRYEDESSRRVETKNGDDKDGDEGDEDGHQDDDSIKDERDDD